MHLINDGITVVQNTNGSAVNEIAWALSGPNGVLEAETNYKCSLDYGDQFDCECIELMAHQL